MDYHSASILQPELSGSERLLWSGQPRQGLRLRASDALLIPFSLLWCGFAIFWEASVFGSEAPIFFRLWGIPFVLIGLYMVIGRFFVEARIRSRTHYGVTNERVLILRGGFSRQTKSLPLRTLSDLSLAERSDGSGTITFGPQHPMAQRMPAGWPGATQFATPAFEMIERARDVYQVIRQAQKDAA